MTPNKPAEIREISLVIGTAGHIDHGKTQLVKAMTGVDCDRLIQEKKRGITIELGFAPLTLPSGRVVSLIDVPGHDRFIRQMVSGASGVDAVILVVAADEGVMPQTREHLDILCLLGIAHGVIVITKKDLVDEEMLQLVREDIAELCKNTFLEGAPVFAVSSLSGDGIDALKQGLERLVDTVTPRERSGAYFMPIDRTFPVAGFGTVVTGTAYKGTVSPGEEVEVYPSGVKSRVRSVQVHGKNVETGFAGQRVAMCLNDLSLDEIKRGDVVCAKGVYRATTCFDARLKLLDSAPEAIEHWQRVRLHIGTSDVLARISLLDEKNIAPGESAPVQFVLEEPVVASIAQRFVIRFYSSLRTIGGGEVLLPYAARPSGKKQRDSERKLLTHLSAASSREEKIALAVDSAGRISTADLTVRVQERREDLLPIIETLQERGRLLFVNVGEGTIYSNDRCENLIEKIRAELKKFHADFPHRPGESPDDLINRLFAEDERKNARFILNKAIERRRFKFDGTLLAMPKFTMVDNSAFEKDRGALLDHCKKCGYQLPTIEELPSRLGMNDKRLNSLLEQLKKSGDIVLLQGTFVLASDVLNPLLERLREIKGGFSLAEVRDITESSRKYVLPILEYLDGKGITRRAGEKRILLKKSEQLFY